MWADYEYHVLKTQTFFFKHRTHGVEGGKLSSFVPPQHTGGKQSDACRDSGGSL